MKFRSILLSILLISISAAAVAKEPAACKDLKILRPKQGATERIDTGVRQEIRFDVENTSDIPMNSVELDAFGTGIASARTAMISIPANKSEIGSVYVTLGPGLRNGARVDAVVIADAGNGCVTSENVTLTYLDKTGSVFFMPGFHYDPEWWNTQQHYLESYEKDQGKREVFFLINAYLDITEKDPDYRFMLAEQDYLKPFSIVYPEQTEKLKKFITEGRAELGGISYNEPQETLIGTEALIRNTVLGRNFQMDLAGKYGDYAWQLDVFGHSPLYPMVIRGVGGQWSAWARGPYHEWAIDRTENQFPSEFSWVSLDGSELMTHFMSAHYSYGWFQMAPIRGGGMQNIRPVYDDLLRTSLTGHVLVPMVDDFATPVDKLGDWFRKWNDKHKTPKAYVSVPSMFFDALEKKMAERDIHIPRVSRDMNPIFPGCAISFTDTKQSNRTGENTLISAEKFGSIAGLLDSGYVYPSLAVDKAWRQLAFTSHHDGITGSFSDQVYLDMISAWREINDIGGAVLNNAFDTISAHIDTRPPAKLKNALPLVVYNSVSWSRDDVVRVTIPGKANDYSIFDSQGNPVTAQIINNPSPCASGAACPDSVAFIAKKVPATGYSVYFVAKQKGNIAADNPVASDGKAVVVQSDIYSLKFDPAAGGAITSIKNLKTGREFVPDGGKANEIVVYHEYPALPGRGEGPWHLNPTGKKEYSSVRPATITVEKGPVFTRVTVKDKINPADVKPDGTQTKYTIVEKEQSSLRDASNFKIRTYDLSQYVGKKGNVYVKFSDAIPSDGWGALVGTVKFSGTKNGAPYSTEFTPNSEPEKASLFSDAGSNVDSSGRRFADNSSYWIYSFDSDPGSKATLDVEIGNQYVVEATDNIIETQTPYYRIQETYIYNGLDRIDFRTFIQRFQGHDRMFRVHFPLTVGGKAIPVYEIGNGAVGRNFGLDVDTAKSSWTLGNTAYNWVDLSHVFFIESRDGGGKPVRRESVGIGEIVLGDSPSRQEELAADELVRAMANVGATVTTTNAYNRRCCDVKKDSVEAQFRIALGSADDNSYIAGMLDKLNAEVKTKIDTALAAEGHVAIMLPAEAGGIPTVLLLTNNNETPSEWIAEIAGEIRSSRTLAAMDLSGGAVTGLKTADAGAALINLGTPSYIIYDNSDFYTLALSLTRSSSAWPSGLWLDPPRRKAPVGDNFEYENWDHEFWYSLYPHEGAWYDADTVRRGYEFNNPLVSRDAAPHTGPLPAAGMSFVETQPKNTVLAAMKPAGFLQYESKTPGALAFRVYETSGGESVNSTLKLFAPVAGGAEQTDYLEENNAGTVTVDGKSMKLDIGAFHTTTVVAKLSSKKEEAKSTDKSSLLVRDNYTGDAYARFWRYNVGAAPYGNLPVTVVFENDKIEITPGTKSIDMNLLVSNEANPAPAKGEVKLDLPDGCTFTGNLKYDIPPKGFAKLPVTISISDSDPDLFTIRAAIKDAMVNGRDVYDVAEITPKKEGEVKISGGQWDFLMDAKNWAPGQKKGKGWVKIKVPGYWETQYPPFDGNAVYRKEITVPDFKGAELALVFQKGADDYAEVYVNGKRACEDAGAAANQKFSCSIGNIGGEKILLEVKVTDNGGNGGINGDIMIAPDAGDGKYKVSLLTPAIELAPGKTGTVKYKVINPTDQAVKGNVIVVSPPETWKWLPATLDFSLPAKGEKVVEIPVAVPAADRVSSIWLLGKFLINGRLVISEAAALNGI